MVNAIYWFLTVELIGLIIFPFLFLLLPNLKDRGYSSAKAIGLLVFSWFMWISGSIKLLPSTSLTLWMVLICFGVFALLVAKKNWSDIKLFLKLEGHVLIFSELVFLLAYFFWIYYKFHDPFINTTEQPMDFALFNASLRSDFFPPMDPWLSGHSVPYYYFGYLIFANVAELTIISPFIAYNLALSTVGALSAAAIFGLSYNLIRLHGCTAGRAVLFSFLGPLMLIFIGNMETLFEIINFRGLGSDSFWDWIGIKNLEALGSSWWGPVDPMWWWRATRVIDTLTVYGSSLDYTITEFPFFSLILGDLHPHMMSLPFILSFCLISLNTFIDPNKMVLGWTISNKSLIFLTALVLGGLPFINIWDIVPFLLFWAALVCIKTYYEDSLVQFRTCRLPNVEVVKYMLSVMLLSFFMYIPYYLSLDSQASGIVPTGDYGTRPIHLFAVWGFFFIIVIPFLVVSLLSKPGNSSSKIYIDNTSIRTSFIWRPWFHRVFFVLGLPILTWVFSQIIRGLLTPSSDALYAVPSRLLTELPLLFLFYGSFYVFLKQLVEFKGRVHIFISLMIVVSLSLITYTEFLQVSDLYGNRMNTVFKTYYQSWLLLSLVAVFAIYFFTTIRIVHNRITYICSIAFKVMICLSFLVVFYYPLAVYNDKMSNSSRDLTLNGLAHVFQEDPGEYKAILWLSENAATDSVLLEAVGDSWSSFSRISSSTGIPTVLGWPWHEQQWRGPSTILDIRESDVKKIYSSANDPQSSDLIDFYGINYIVVGPREIAKYGMNTASRISRLGEVVFSQDGFKIYYVSESEF